MASRRKNRNGVSKLNEQKKLANIRAKYGPAMKAAPVIVKRVEGVMAKLPAGKPVIIVDASGQEEES